MTRSTRAAPIALFAALVAAGAAGAQATRAADVPRAPSLIRVHVADSLGVPIADAEVALMRGLRQVLTSGRTNTAGSHEFIVALDSTDYSIVARKVGYARGDRFIAVARNTVDARVVMKRIEGALAPVTVTAVNLKRKSYHIDADAIAATSTNVNDGLDIIRFMRPNMATSRSGGIGAGCPALQNIWVNGRRYMGTFVIVDPLVRTRARTMPRGMQLMGAGNMTILSEIAPEHIEEMNYRDCFEKNMKTVGANNALFITLKPGVGYKLGYGSFVMGDTAAVVTAR